MSSRSSVLETLEPTPTKAIPSEVSEDFPLKYYPDSLALLSPRVFINSAGGALGGSDVDALRLAKIIALLFPEHRRIVEALVREFARLRAKIMIVELG